MAKLSKKVIEQAAEMEIAKAGLPSGDNPFKAGSRKAAIYDVFLAAGGGEKGLKAAHVKAKSLEIKEGTVKSWAGSWMKGVPKAKAKGEGAKVKRERITKDGAKASDDHEAHFKYSTRSQAEAARLAVCDRSGLRPHAFHILEHEGKFAVCPIHYRPIGPIPTFNKGDVVYDAYIINSKAVVIDPGPEQSVIRFDLEARPPFQYRPREQLSLNRYLVKLPDEPVRKVKRERVEEQPAKAPEFKESNAKKALRKETAKLVTPGGKVRRVKDESKGKVKRVRA